MLLHRPFRTLLDGGADAAHGNGRPYKSALLVLALAVVLLFYIDVWLGLAAAITAYATAAKLANHEMDRVFLIRSKAKLGSSKRWPSQSQQRQSSAGMISGPTALRQRHAAFINWTTDLQLLFNRPMYSSLLVANCGSSRCFAAPHSFSSLLLAPVGR
jgi:hypothetical protein